MKRWTSKHPKIIVDENFSFNLGPDSILLNYKISDEETLHSIEIRLSDLEAFKKTITAIERELDSTPRSRPAPYGTGKYSLASGYIRGKTNSRRERVE